MLSQITRSSGNALLHSRDVGLGGRASRRLGVTKSGLPLVVRCGEAWVDGVEGVFGQRVDNLNFGAVVLDNLDLVQRTDLLGWYRVHGPIPERRTQFQSCFLPTLSIHCVRLGDFDGVTLNELLYSKVNVINISVEIDALTSYMATYGLCQVGNRTLP